MSRGPGLSVSVGRHAFQMGRGSLSGASVGLGVRGGEGWGSTAGSLELEAVVCPPTRIPVLEDGWATNT